ncbi:neuromedin-U isoform X2 [Toxotes jaculatrix]|uniref:neuromedin-U isoform X2 n=1 Tax=Toxotes jaculatrix TaxID=941984 RepID=UPI001B3AD1CE|nr:neuromedin-U isoform X2 [Toxotes jaculatrix]
MTQSSVSARLWHEPSYFSDVSQKLSEEQEVQRAQPIKGKKGKRKDEGKKREREREREDRPTREGDEDLPEPKSACAARSLQQPAQPQQQRHESTQHGQHHPGSPTHSHHTSLQKRSSRTSASHNRPEAATRPDAVCSSYLSADLQFWASDVLGELCVLMLVQKSKELKVRENSKRAELQGPGGIQSRGYFLYRPRNGRRSLEYE